jgi:stage II sporulation protein D
MQKIHINKLLFNIISKLFLSGLFFLLLGFFALFQPSSARGEVSIVMKDIRVGLNMQAAYQYFSVQGDYRVLDVVTGSELAVARPGEQWQAKCSGGAIELVRDGETVAVSDNPVAIEEMTRNIYALSVGDVLTDLTPEGEIVVIGAGGQKASLDSGMNKYQVLTREGQSRLQGNAEQNLLVLTSGGVSRKYRGSLEFRANRDAMTVINQLPLEQYLYGVIPGEMPSGWPEEAIKAQAVSARSYAMAQTTAGSYAGYGFDVQSNQQSQVYQGMDAENPRVSALVDGTRGQVLTCRGTVITAIFHSSSGGCTEDSEDVWQNPLEYIKAKPDPADMNDAHYNWKKSMDHNQLVEQLNQKGYGISQVCDIEELERTSTGARVKKMAVDARDADGRPVTIEICNADAVRSALGLDSSLFVMEKEIDQQGFISNVEFKGSGWGHGLGMSQYGALGMAKEGYNYQEILKYYYNDVKIEKLYDI